MSHTTLDNGRLCNQIIRNLAVSLIAEKHDLHVSYASYDKITDLGFPLFCGKHRHAKTISLNDDNYFSILEAPDLDSNVDGNPSYFQTSAITNMLYAYIRDALKPKIMDKNPFKDRYNSNNDACVHIRLTDAKRWNPGVAYYLNTLSTLTFDTLYIATDEAGHDIIKDIQMRYPDSIVMNYDEYQTLQFASTCKHIVLSHGSFSAMIGYLSFFSQIHYPEYEQGRIWYGDMFSIDGWIKHTVCFQL
jgi:hypothetical protein